MDPRTYARLYGPWRPAPAAPARTGVILGAMALWGLTLVALSWITLLVGVVAVFGAAAGEPVGWFLAGYAGCLLGGAALLLWLRRWPVVRRMASDRRSLLLAALTCPVPVLVAVVTWAGAG